MVIAGRSYEIIELKAVRERDATLIVHLQTESHTGPTIVVAERISGSAREQLSRAGVAWLDRRGHLWVRAQDLFVNTRVPPSSLPPPRVRDVLSATGLDISLALLVSPEESQGVNELARRIGRSPGRVSEILNALRSEGLVEAGNRPVIPELFWEVAERWRVRWTPLAALPPRDRLERYRLTGTLGAVALEAPLVGGARSSPQLYVGDRADLSAMANAYGGGGWAAAEIAVCPSRFGFSLRGSLEREGYIVAGHLVVALDLAQDRARGRAVLEGWSPIEAARVW